MTAKQLVFSEDARRKLKRGIDTVATAVSTTLGPKGRNVAIDKKFGAPTITHDGVTVAKEIELEDPYENMGAQLFKEAAIKTNDIAGDGTTTATVLAQHMVHEGLKNVAAGANPMLLKQGIEAGTQALSNKIRGMAISIDSFEEIASVASISAQDPEIGKLIATVMDKVGKDGVITVEESKALEFETEYVEGMQFDRGYISAYFITDAEHDGSRHRRRLHPDPRQEDQQRPGHHPRAGEAGADRPQEPGHHRRRRGRRGAGDAGAQQAARHDQRPGHQGPRLWRPPQGHAPGHRHPDRRPGHHRGDGPQAGHVQISDLGRAGKVVSTKDDTTIVDGKGDEKEITGRVEQIKVEIDRSTSDYDKEKLQERLAKLAAAWPSSASARRPRSS
jgi:chaperonin GroEL